MALTLDQLAARVKIKYAPTTDAQRKGLGEVCRVVVKKWRPGLTRKQVSSIAAEMYFKVVDRVSKKVQPPDLAQSRVMVPTEPKEKRTPGGIILR